MQFRTDLAIEAREIAGENTGGIEFKKYSENGLEISRLIVKNQKARQALGKEIGTYITIELPSLTDNFTETDKRLETVGNEIKRLLPVNGLVLVAGLGNMEITPDSLGPKTSRRVLATRHIGGEIARSTGLDRLRPVAVMQTGVTGQTGIETGEYILSTDCKRQRQVDASNAYHGGAIAPGMGISLDALTNHGALLSSVDMKAPKKVISSNTSDCIRSGIMFGTACMLDGMVDMFNEECKTECKVIATGGLAPLAIKNCRHDIIFDENIILDGLKIIYERNKK